MKDSFKKRKRNRINYSNHYLYDTIHKNTNEIDENASGKRVSKENENDHRNYASVMPINSVCSQVESNISVDKTINDNGRISFQNFKNDNIYGHKLIVKDLKDHPCLNKTLGEVGISGETDFMNKYFDLRLPENRFDKDSDTKVFIHDLDIDKDTKKEKEKRYGLSVSETERFKIGSSTKISYEDARKLNELWNLYVDEIIRVTNSNELSLETVAELDLNGAYIEIHKSYCATYLGLKGIVLLETLNAFRIVTLKDKLLTILKNKSIFILTIKDKSYYLHGIQLLRDPALKSAKKNKVLQTRYM